MQEEKIVVVDEDDKKRAASGATLFQGEYCPAERQRGENRTWARVGNEVALVWLGWRLLNVVLC